MSRMIYQDPGLPEPQPHNLDDWQPPTLDEMREYARAVHDARVVSEAERARATHEVAARDHADAVFHHRLSHAAAIAAEWADLNPVERGRLMWALRMSAGVALLLAERGVGPE